jgi:hypothetical protein
MSSEPSPSDERVVLVVDLNGELLTPLQMLEEVLLALGLWEADDAEDPPERDPLHLPAPLANRVALNAVKRLHAALRPTQSLGSEHGRLLGPDGICEHAPLSIVTLPVADIATLSATAQVLGHPALDPDVANLVVDFARSFAVDVHTRGRIDRPEFVSRVARVAGLLDLAPTEDTQLLIARLAANPAGLDLALTEAEEAAYRRTADRMHMMWADTSGIEPYLY